MKLEHQDPKNICYAQMQLFRVALLTEGWSKSQSKPNEIILCENRCSFQLLWFSQPCQGVSLQEVNGRKVSPGM